MLKKKLAIALEEKQTTSEDSKLQTSSTVVNVTGVIDKPDELIL